MSYPQLALWITVGTAYSNTSLRLSNPKFLRQIRIFEKLALYLNINDLRYFYSI